MSTAVASRLTGLTTLPPTPEPLDVPQQRRVTGKLARHDLLMMGGAGVSAISTTMLLFGRLTPMSGTFGFLIVAFVLYIVIYAVIASVTESRPTVVDKVMNVLLTSSAVIALFALATVIIFVIIRGWPALKHSNFYTEDLSTTGPLDPLTQGGISHAIVGTLIITALSLVFTVPLAVVCAVFLNESKSRSAQLVRTVVTAMTALPSILAGLFVFVVWILVFDFQRSGLAASIAVSIMMLPIIIRSADVVLRLVPGGLREAAAALGAPRWRTVWHVVLPTARSGIMTSVILGVARGIGETAPVLLTAGYTAAMNTNPFENPMVNLPLAAFELVKSPQPDQIARGFGAAATLMVLVLILFFLARILGGRQPGQLSQRQSKRRLVQSRHDLERIEGRHKLQGVHGS
ncbi:MAG: phosphate ABC transporter permease PstA [Actinomycetia bacterium]|nr:phosphate ABC transporter permease PstA [Actinomycetes bacterium]